MEIAGSVAWHHPNPNDVISYLELVKYNRNRKVAGSVVKREQEEGDGATRTRPKWKNKPKSQAKIIYINMLRFIKINKRCIHDEMPTEKKNYDPLIVKPSS